MTTDIKELVQRMSDARTVIANIKQRVYALHGGTVEAKLGSALAADILAALAEAGLGIVHKPKSRAKLNAKAMKYLDDLAEAEEAMAGKHALSILLKHYREMTEAANEQ